MLSLSLFPESYRGLLECRLLFITKISFVENCFCLAVIPNNKDHRTVLGGEA